MGHYSRQISLESKTNDLPPALSLITTDLVGFHKAPWHKLPERRSVEIFWIRIDPIAAEFFFIH